jgi:hypothetical protein
MLENIWNLTSLLMNDHEVQKTFEQQKREKKSVEEDLYTKHMTRIVYKGVDIAYDQFEWQLESSHVEL